MCPMCSTDATGVSEARVFLAQRDFRPKFQDRSPACGLPAAAQSDFSSHRQGCRRVQGATFPSLGFAQFLMSCELTFQDVRFYMDLA